MPIWTVNATGKRCPGFHRAPLLCAARTFLWHHTSDRPARAIQLLMSEADGDIDFRPVVPKGRFELPRA